MYFQPSNKRSGCPQFYSRSLPHFSRLSLKLPPLSTTLTAFSKVWLPTLLIRDFEYRAINIRDFPSTIDAGYIRYSITYYETHVESCFAIINSVCYYCGLFIQPLSWAVVLKSDLVVVTALKNQVFHLNCFSHCGEEIDKYCFCFPCYCLIKQKKDPKFSFLNKVNVIIYQDYPPILETLTLIEEILIAWYHLVMSILKLCLNRALWSVAY